MLIFRNLAGSTVKKLLITLVLVAVGLAGVAYWISSSHYRNGHEDLFTFAAVERGPLSETVGGTGIVQPSEVVIIGSELSGRVIEINADFNDRVAEGAVLARLDDRMARRKFEQAEIAVRLAQADVERAKAQRDGARNTAALLEKLPENAGYKKDLIVARAALSAAEATVRAAELKVEEAEEARRQADLGLKLTVIRVPTIERSGTKPEPSGMGIVELEGGPTRDKRSYVVMDRKISLNQLISPPTTGQLFTLTSDLGQVLLQVLIAEGDISKVRVGQEADFTVSAYSEGDTHFRAKVAEIRMLPANELGAVFYRVILEAPNQKDGDTAGVWKLRPGMTAAVDIIRRQHKDVWKMPNSALSFHLDVPHQTEAARAKLAHWQERPDRDLWKPVWVMDEHHKPWPLLVRTGGKNSAGETGIRDTQFSEVLEWDPEITPPEPGKPESWPRVIISAPSATKAGLFGGSLPSFKL